MKNLTVTVNGVAYNVTVEENTNGAAPAAAPVSYTHLVQAWFSLMGRSQRRKKPTQERFEPLVTAPFVSVASRCLLYTSRCV